MSAELFKAIEQNDSARVAARLTAGASPNAPGGEPHWPPLHFAINQLDDGPDIEVVLLLLKHGAKVNAWESRRHHVTPLLLAILNDQKQVLDALLKAGANPNVRNDEGDSPLRVSVRNGDRETASLLLQAGALKTANEYGGLHGLTALGMAAKKLDLPMLELLLGAGANPLALDEDNKVARQRLPPPNSGIDSVRRAAEALLREYEAKRGGRKP